MDRRHFLSFGAATCALAVSGYAIRPGIAAGSSPSQRFRLLRLDPIAGRFRPHRVMPGEGLGSTPLRMRFEGLSPAAEGGLTELSVGALFDGSGQVWRHHAWYYRRDDQMGSSRASGFDLPHTGLHGLAFDFREGGQDWRHEEMILGRSRPLVPGRYLLVPAAVGFSGLRWGNEAGQSLAGQASFDALAFVVEPVLPAIEEPLRADLLAERCARAAEDPGLS